MSDPSSGASPHWDAAQYERFERERSRPFHDLVARVPARPFRRIADLGCGTGRLTRTLVKRWPHAEIWGIDRSAEMLARVGAVPVSANLHFVREDLRDWRPPRPLDLVVSNAALQWVPDHARLLKEVAGWLGPTGVLAVQVPNNREEAASRILREFCSESPWKERIRRDDSPAIEAPSFYRERLRDLGLEVEMWETIYHHSLAGPDDIVEWLRGTTLRPILSSLPRSEGEEFLSALKERIRPAYPADRHGVLFPFRRLFFVAERGRPQGSRG